MEDEEAMCSICHEIFEPNHTIVQPKHCTHQFHAICINIWLARHRSCPLCRRRISLSTQMPWRSLFAVALVITREMALERAAYTIAFLSILLKRYDTSRKWYESRDALIAAMEQFELGSIRLPFIDLTSRTTAKREKRKWTQLYEQIAEEHPRNSEHVRSARRRIIEWANMCLMGVYVPS
jgi:hypothetical protein